MSLIERTAGELKELQSRGDATAEAIADAFLTSIRERDPKIQAFLHVDEAVVREQARAVDAKRKSGQKLGPLAGVPVAIKDVLCTQGVPTTCSSKMLQNFVPPYDAHVIEKLKAEIKQRRPFSSVQERSTSTPCGLARRTMTSADCSVPGSTA